MCSLMFQVLFHCREGFELNFALLFELSTLKGGVDPSQYKAPNSMHDGADKSEGRQGGEDGGRRQFRRGMQIPSDRPDREETDEGLKSRLRQAVI